MNERRAKEDEGNPEAANSRPKGDKKERVKKIFAYFSAAKKKKKNGITKELSQNLRGEELTGWRDLTAWSELSIFFTGLWLRGSAQLMCLQPAVPTAERRETRITAGAPWTHGGRAVDSLARACGLTGSGTRLCYFEVVRFYPPHKQTKRG